MRNVNVYRSLFDGSRFAKKLARDEAGTAILEFTVVLAFFSILACVALVNLDHTANTTLQTHSVAMEKYNENPSAYQCHSQTGC